MLWAGPAMSAVVSETLEGYSAAQFSAARVVAAVSPGYDVEGGRRRKERLKPLIDVIERASPGVVELELTPDRPGFAVRVGERPFPQQYEAELRGAAAAYLEVGTAGERGRKGVAAVIARLVGMIRSEERRVGKVCR